MAYQYDIFISYKRSNTGTRWVRNYLYPLLNDRLQQNSPVEVRLSCDFQIEDGALWPAEIENRIQNSAILLAVWSAEYFRSSWCMAEWQSFRRREASLGLSSRKKPTGLVYPIRYADGDHFHPDAKLTQCQKDFSTLNCAEEALRNSNDYLDFDRLVSQMAIDLVHRLNRAPNWRRNFPIAKPRPLGPAPLRRPVV